MGDDNSPSKKRLERETSSLRPMTIQQINTAASDPNKHQDSNFELDGAEITQVKIVGNVLRFEQQATFELYQVEDGTGCIDCKFWIDKDESEQMGQRERQSWYWDMPELTRPYSSKQ